MMLSVTSICQPPSTADPPSPWRSLNIITKQLRGTTLRVVDRIPIGMLVFVLRAQETTLDSIPVLSLRRASCISSGGYGEVLDQGKVRNARDADLAVNGGGGLVLLKDVAARQQISKRYLEHMMTLLRNPGLVVAERGSAGGYRLARPASDIRLDEIFEALEGEIAPVECVRDRSVCDRASDCVARTCGAT